MPRNYGECARPNCTNKAQKAATRLCEKHHRLLLKTNQLPPLPTDHVPSPHAHLKDLANQGYTPAAIAAATGLNATTITNTINRPNCYRSTRDAILNINPNTATHIPAWRATRRLRALAAAGHRIAHIATATNLSASLLYSILHDQRITITNTTFTQIDTYWNNHKNDPATTPHARIAKYNWATPWQWDNIDDPTTNLHGNTKVNATTTHQALKRAINQYGPQTTARLLGFQQRTITRYLNTPTITTKERAHILNTLRLHKNRTYLNKNRPQQPTKATQ